MCETTSVSTAGTFGFTSDKHNGTTLRFSDKAVDVLANCIDLVFAKSSLQYLEHWPQMFQAFKAAAWLLFDRVPLIDHPTDSFCVQIVPARYFDYRLPIVMLSASSWLRF